MILRLSLIEARQVRGRDMGEVLLQERVEIGSTCGCRIAAIENPQIDTIFSARRSDEQPKKEGRQPATHARSPSGNGGQNIEMADGLYRLEMACPSDVPLIARTIHDTHNIFSRVLGKDRPLSFIAIDSSGN
ncbi:MAG TPA: hypothetical protein VHD36_03285 [Pirellulales bacterium]|nr:hypothetical protein [Pirellulales bacterium]